MDSVWEAAERSDADTAAGTVVRKLACSWPARLACDHDHAACVGLFLAQVRLAGRERPDGIHFDGARVGLVLERKYGDGQYRVRLARLSTNLESLPDDQQPAVVAVLWRMKAAATLTVFGMRRLEAERACERAARVMRRAQARAVRVVRQHDRASAALLSVQLGSNADDTFGVSRSPRQRGRPKAEWFTNGVAELQSLGLPRSLIAELLHDSGADAHCRRRSTSRR